MAKQIKRTFFRPHDRVVYSGVLDDGSFPVPRVKQEFKRECDMNNVIKHFSVTGMFNHVAQRQAQFAELPDAVDFQDSLHLVQAAETAFMSLPAKTRDRFGNRPDLFLAFMGDPANAKEARELGLLKPQEEPPAPIRVEVSNPEPTNPPPKA